jgi:hypothetical protein
MEASANRIEVGRVIGESFDLYKRHAGALLGTAVVVFVISGVIEGILRDEGGIVLSLIATVVNMVAVAIYTGFVVKVVQDVRADGRRDLSVGELISSAGPAIPALIGNGILRGIGIAIGFVLLIVPGLILLTIWSVTSPAIVAERQGVMAAFGRSHELVRGQAWTVFGCIVVAFLIVIAVSIVLASVGAAIGGIAGAIIGAVLAGVLSAPVAALVSSILFFDLGGGAAPAPAAPVVPAPAA